MAKALPLEKLQRNRTAPLQRRAPKLLTLGKTDGRPTMKTPELIDELCNRIASGRSISSVTSDDDMPDTAVFYRWKLADTNFSELVDFAREHRKEITRQKLIDVADRVITDPHLDPNRVNAAAHAWHKAESLMGAKQQKLQVSGQIEVSDVSDVEIVRRIAFLFNKIKNASGAHDVPQTIEATAISKD